jgi:tetratricopeptide (TPR) repeat protein
VDIAGPEISTKGISAGTINAMTEVDNKCFETSKLRNSFFISANGPIRRAWHSNRGLSFKGFSLFLLSFALIVSSVHAEKYPVVRIIFVSSQSDAEEILAEISKGAAFAVLARERSVDEKSRNRYGEIEPAAFESLDMPLKEAALRLKDGEVSGVIPLSDNRRAIVLAVDMTYYRKGARAFRSNDFRTAETNFLKHVELNPDAVKARVRLGQIQEAAKELSKAEENYRAAIRFDRLCEEAYERLGELYLRSGQFQQARDVYDKGLENIPGSKPLRAGIAKINVKIPVAKVKPPQNEPIMDDITKKAAPNSNVRRIEITATDMQGGHTTHGESSKGDSTGPGIAKGQQDNKKHLRIIVTGNESDADDILSLVKNGMSFALLAKERSIDENTSQSYGYLGEVAVDSLNSHIREAASEMKEGETSGVIRMEPDRYALLQITDMRLYREGERAFIAGDFRTAGEKLLKYVEANPDAVKARTIIGKIYEDKKEYSSAIGMYKKAISFSPKTVLIYERLARVYLFLGEYNKARDVYIDGLKQISSSPVLEEGVEMADMLLIGEGKRMP